MSTPLDQFLISAEADIRTALAVIDRNAHGVAFAVDSQGHLRGILTDGDIRRALLRGVGLDALVKSVMRVDCVTLPHDATPEAILTSLGDRIEIITQRDENGRLVERAAQAGIEVIPLLDTEGRPVDYASHYRHHRLPVMEPEVSGNELNYIMECIKTNWLSSQGPFVRRFEQEFGHYVGSPHAVAVCNGAAALHLALIALGVGPGDEVIVPDLTFAASVNAVLHAGATPVLVDVTRDTWTLDPKGVARAITSQTKAIMPVHLYGQPCEMEALMALARNHGLLVIEDAAEALGAQYHGRHVGGFGDAAAFSFYGNKLITTGEGGMVTFKDENAAARARVLRNHGMDPDRRYWHEEAGYNYRLTNLQAAVGVAQLERIESFITRKIELASRYSRALSVRDELVLPIVWPDTRNVFWLYSLIVDPERTGLTRDDLMERLLLRGIETRPLFYPLHFMPPYRRFARQGSYPNAEWLSANGLSLPSAVTLKDEELDHVTAAISQILDVRLLRGLVKGLS